MGEFFGAMFVLAVVIMATVSSTTFTYDANEVNKLLNETCSKNGGIETSKVSVDDWYFKCKDGARFTIKR
jgi:hypothetical protein